MTKDQLVQAIADQYPSASRNLISDAQILRFLNRELQLLNATADLRKTIRETTLSYTADGTVSAPSDFKKPISIIDRTNNFTYRRVDKTDIYRLEDGSQKMYAVQDRDTNIFLQANSSSANLTLVYYSTHDSQDNSGTFQTGLIASTDKPLLEPEFDEYLILRTLGKMFFKERKFEDYGVVNAEAARVLQNIQDNNATQEDQVIQIMTSYIDAEPSFNDDTY